MKQLQKIVFTPSAFNTHLETLKHAQIFKNIHVYMWQEVVRGLFSGFFTNRRNSLPASSDRWKLDDSWSGNVSVIPPRFLSDQTYVYDINMYVLFLKPKQMLVSFGVNPSSTLPGNSELSVPPEWKGTFRSSTFYILIARRKHMIGHETTMVRSVVCEPPSRWSAIRVDLLRSFFSSNGVE